ncbi:MAG: substrate-binding domain-containing protein [Burkholderiaceae bacterium]
METTLPAEPIRMISSMATKEVLAELAAQYQRASAHRVELKSAGGVEVAKTVHSGAVVDVVVLAAKAIDQLTADGKLAPGRVDLVRSGIALATKAGAAKPDISSEQAVREAVLTARTLGYSTGPSGVYLLGLFERWGILEQVRSRIVQAPPGVPVGSLVARGEVDLGFQQLSELMHMQGITVLGPLPDAIQSLTTFSAAVSATSAQVDSARALIAFMAAPAAAALKRAHGMEAA